jgi:hypothetical protein
MANSLETQAGAAATGKTKRELALEAQKEQQGIVTQIRVNCCQALFELDEIGGKDNLGESIVAIVTVYPEGILQTRLNQVVPEFDARLRQQLVAKGLILQEKAGQTWLLKPVPAADQAIEAEVVG